MTSPIQIIPTCGRNNCGSRCLLYAHVQNGKILKMTTDTSSGTDTEPPLTACARGLNYHKTYLGNDRLRTPLKRVGERGEGKFVPITWEEAIDWLTREWIRIRDTWGPSSRYVNYSWGISALMRPNSLAKRLLALDGGFLDYYGSYSTGCTSYTTPYLYGTNNTGNSMYDLENSSAILLWGHNPQETGFDHMMYFLKKARKKGIPIFCIDPRRSDTVRVLDAEWIPIRPASDAALMDAMAYVIITEKRYDEDFIHRCCIGFTADTMPPNANPQDNYFSYILGEQDHIPKTPAWAEAITGVAADTIVRLARIYASGESTENVSHSSAATPAVKSIGSSATTSAVKSVGSRAAKSVSKPAAALIPGYGMQRHANGEQAVRGAIALACLTGNVGRSGGWAAGPGYCPTHAQPSMPHVENPVKSSISFFTWTDAVDHGLEMTSKDGVKGTDKLDSNIKMILNLGGNSLINQHSDINRTAAILKDLSKCEFIVCSDLFMTASARFADLLLPSISLLEMDNITTPWENGNFIGFNNKIVEPLHEGRFEYDWLKEIARNLNLYKAFTEGHETTEDWLRHLYTRLQTEEPELPSYESLKKSGVYRYKNTPKTIAFSKQRQDIEKYPFPTPSGKVEIYSSRLAEEQNPAIPPIPGYVPASEGFGSPLQKTWPLQLIGWHTKRRCHSIHDNNREMDRLDPQTLRMHPRDAVSRGIKNGDTVLIFNSRGQIQMPVQLTEDIIPGCVAISQGAWYTPDKNGTDLRGSINVLTSLTPTPLAKSNPQHTNLVEVQAFSPAMPT